MAEEWKNPKEHTVHMTDRKQVRISGVTDVLRFDEEAVAVDTTYGLLLLKGEGLHVGHLNLEQGEIAIDGQIDEMTYAENNQPMKHGFLSRLFR